MVRENRILLVVVFLHVTNVLSKDEAMDNESQLLQLSQRTFSKLIIRLQFGLVIRKPSESFHEKKKRKQIEN